MRPRQPGNAMRRSERGVTLVETMIVVVVLAILAAIALPSFQRMIERSRLVAAAEAVYAHLQFARSESIKLARAENLRLSIRAGTPWCLGISNSTANCNCTTAGACRYGPDTDGDGVADMERNLRGGDFTNVGMATTASEVQINSARGSFNGTAGTITLTSPSGLELRVVFSRMGRTRICSPSGASNVSGYPTC